MSIRTTRREKRKKKKWLREARPGISPSRLSFLATRGNWVPARANCYLAHTNTKVPRYARDDSLVFYPLTPRQHEDRILIRRFAVRLDRSRAECCGQVCDQGVGGSASAGVVGIAVGGIDNGDGARITHADIDPAAVGGGSGENTEARSAGRIQRSRDAGSHWRHCILVRGERASRA